MSWSTQSERTPMVAGVGNARLYVRREHNGTRRYSFDERHYWKDALTALRRAAALSVKTSQHSDFGYPVAVFTSQPNPHYREA